ncbi:MAG TPA: response regulator, partial [Phenylobacterium sp.]|nr:response regulator [Phenylobacterium sp.]
MVNVLVVEDEPDVADLVEDALVEAGFSVTVAHDDRTAFQKLELEPRSFAAIVTDINLGAGVTGFDIARRARLLNDEIKVIYISGQGPHSEQFSV